LASDGESQLIASGSGSGRSGTLGEVLIHLSGDPLKYPSVSHRYLGDAKVTDQRVIGDGLDLVEALLVVPPERVAYDDAPLSIAAVDRQKAPFNCLDLQIDGGERAGERACEKPRAI
jgi:hypothetical protein